jgi:hypothetical protein
MRATKPVPLRYKAPKDRQKASGVKNRVKNGNAVGCAGNIVRGRNRLNIIGSEKKREVPPRDAEIAVVPEPGHDMILINILPFASVSVSTATDIRYNTRQ